nr:uncharacterized protein LOC112717905 [Arachis hypogaea]
MSWNCRGAASGSFRRTLLEFERLHRPDVVILLETRCSGIKARNVISSFGFSFSHIEEAVGYSGGIWIMWKDPDLAIDVILTKNQFVHMKVKRGNKEEWFLIAVYANPREDKRRELWTDMHHINQNITGGWLVVEDFNDISDPSEKKSGGRVDFGACRRFKRWIDSCALIDLGSVGQRFTWRGPQWENLDKVFKHLDRALCNSDWRLRYQEAIVDVLARVNSDHHPILVHMNPKGMVIKDKPFRYEAMWELHPNFKGFVEEKWKGQTHHNGALNLLMKDLAIWNKEVFGHIGKQKRKILSRLSGIQRAPSYGESVLR